MKRITIIILAVVAIVASSVSCQKVNDIDKRLSDLEEVVSDLKAQVLAGAVITSVTKTDDGCTFTLSNGQSYTVTNGTNGNDGTDGEAIIADVKIEDGFVVLTLKNGDTLRISYQNPLSMVTLIIIPDFSDGSVYSFSDDGTFILRVGVTPEKYIDKLSNDDDIICKAYFRSVITKASQENPDFTVVGDITSASVEDGYLTAVFTLSEGEMEMMCYADYAVSFTMEDSDGTKGASTSYVPVSWYTRDGGGGDGEAVDLEAVDLGLSVKWANMNLGAINPGDKGDLYAWGATEPLVGTPDWSCCPYSILETKYKHYVRFTKYTFENETAILSFNADVIDNKTVLELMDDAAASELGSEWRIPGRKEFEELCENCDPEWAEMYNSYGIKFISKKNGNSIFIPVTMDERVVWQYEYSYKIRPEEIKHNLPETDEDKIRQYLKRLAAKYSLSFGNYWTSSLDERLCSDAACLSYGIDEGILVSSALRYNGLSIRPVYGKVNVTGVSLNADSAQLDMGKSLTLVPEVFPYYAFDKSVVWSSSDPNVASVDAQGKVTGVSAGDAVITVMTNDVGFTASCNVTVTMPAIDMGLSVKWAAANLGASLNDASGDYFAWGATEPNPGGAYIWSKCPYCSDGYGEKFSKYVPMGKMSYWGGSGSPDNKRKLETGDDAATAKLGGTWRTPTSAEFEELLKSCDTEWTTMNDVNGLKVTSRTTGNSIFLPAAGHRSDYSLSEAGTEGIYLSSSLATDIPDHAMSLVLTSGNADTVAKKRFLGQTIRAVTE